MGKKLLKTHKISFEGDNLDFNWYAVVVAFNHERRVAEVLRSRFENMGAGDKLEEVFVPIEEWEEETLGRVRKDGTRAVRKVKKSRNLLESGYIFIRMCMTDETWNIVRQTSGVSGWLKMDGRPQVVPNEDILRMKQQLVKEEDKVEKVKFNGKIGDRVRIKNGPFENFEGKILNAIEAEVLVVTDNGVKIEVSPSILEVM
ncbi:transcription antiterminator [Bacillus phage G]|uniref:Gp582 n=1 Tax=Bacillus phage G TaxID=2884420 RepID=G3MAW2_9CAUD|nr:transcription antiterminator [Bacillus phage G]AEO93827.1 gp582 [Bacillus phage G]